MKFAKELEDQLVPEWRVYYFDYKGGKKRIKAISKALRNANRTPQTPGRSKPQNIPSANGLPFTHYDFNAIPRKQSAPGADPSTPGSKQQTPTADRPDLRAQIRRMSTTMFTMSPPMYVAGSTPKEDVDENYDSDGDDTPLNRATLNGDGKKRQRYGSIIGSPPDDEIPQQMPQLTLPDPAIEPPGADQQKKSAHRPGTGRDTVNDTKQANSSDKPIESLSSLPKHLLRRSDRPKTPNEGKRRRDKVAQMFSKHNHNSPLTPIMQQTAHAELDSSQQAFYTFLNNQLDKIENFYQSKEEDSNKRLNTLRAQLHEMRDQRSEDIKRVRQGKKAVGDGRLENLLPETPLPIKHRGQLTQRVHDIKKPIEDVLTHKPTIGKTSKAMQKLASPEGTPQMDAGTGASDFVRRSHTNNQVPYRFAKRRLKLALQEFYRGLELIKSYALLNQTAFRKLNKKYDKAVNARPPLRYLNEKVNEAYFVKSTIIEHHLVAVEDLYARYFERGHRKVAVNKLRSKLNTGDKSSTTFRNGLYVAAGACFGVAGLVSGVKNLFDDDPLVASDTSYLLQIYGGYFLALLLVMLFVLNCWIWTAGRISYIFIFEFDTRHVLDWRQLAEVPCFLLFLNGLFVWLNFEFDSATPMYRYWPVVMIGITALLLAFPFRIFYYRARKWWAMTNFRLLFAGLYPVEFRDFYLGDMYCSQTYSMSQIEVFFCLYARNWNDPAQCNSTHSRLLGFLTTLPAIWRFLQCIRRYYDSGMWFPHLANCAKYGCNVLYYMSLSLYRISVGHDDAWKYKVVFIVSAAVNGAYSSFWDVSIDWSLGNPWAKHPFLRDNLAYRRPWVYYLAIVLDVVMRQQWIFYVIFVEDLQHSAAMSFFIGLIEVLRRGMWSVFRVENEHCNNVIRNRASRDIDLPYKLNEQQNHFANGSVNGAAKADAPTSDTVRQRKRGPPYVGNEPVQKHTTGTEHDIERQISANELQRQQEESTDSTSTVNNTSAGPGIRALQRVGTLIAAAHAQDFQKKRRPELAGTSPSNDTMLNMNDSSEEEEDDDDVGDGDDGGKEGDEDHYVESDDHDHGKNDNQDHPPDHHHFGPRKRSSEDDKHEDPDDDDDDDVSPGASGSGGSSSNSGGRK